MDSKLLSVILDKKITMAQLEEFSRERGFKTGKKRKKDVIEFLLSTDLKDEDIKGLNDLAFGPKTEKTYVAYLCKFETKDTIKEIADKLIFMIPCDFLIKSNMIDSQNLEVISSITQEKITVDAYTNLPTFGTVTFWISSRLNFGTKTVTISSGNYDLSVLVADGLNRLLNLNIRPMTAYKMFHSVTSTIDALTFAILDFIFNRLNTIAIIEKVEGIEFEPVDSENITSIRHKGDSVLDDPETCRLICLGNKIVGFRAYIKYITSRGNGVFTHVSLIFKESGTKLSVAKNNYNDEAIEELFEKIKAEYINLMTEGIKDEENTKKRIIEIEANREVS